MQHAMLLIIVLHLEQLQIPVIIPHVLLVITERVLNQDLGVGNKVKMTILIGQDIREQHQQVEPGLKELLMEVITYMWKPIIILPKKQQLCIPLVLI